MSGTEDIERRLSKLESVLDRRTPIDSLDALIYAVNNRSKSNPIPIGSIALGLDSSVFLRLGTHKQSADIVDYLSSRHQGPLILPGQAIQEFWNNQLAAVDTVSAGLKKKFETLKNDANKIDINFGDYAVRMEAILNEFSSEYGYVYDESTLRSTSNFLEVLKDKAILSYVPRMRFYEMAIARKRTKTPPGFKDEGDGDFFIWVEFLSGLLIAKESGVDFKHAVLLTHDTKIDWSRDGVAHPVLMAEMRKLFDVSFEVWQIDRLYTEINKA